MEKKLQVSTSLIICILYLCFISLGSNYSSFDGAKIRFIVKILFFTFLIIFGYNKKEDRSKLSFWYLPFFFLFPFSNYISLFSRGIISFSYSNELIFYFFDCLLTAFIEEKIFRSLFIFSNDENKNKAIIFSSIVFALSHLLNGINLASFLQVIYTFGLGIVLGSVYAYGGGFIYCFLLHFLFNFFNGYLYSCFNNTKIDTLYIVSNVIVGVVIVIYYLSILLIKRKKK